MRREEGNASDTLYDAYRDTRYFGSLNGVRFLCIIAVIWHHSPLWQQLLDTAQITRRGFVGVDFFFVISGFLITTLILREEDRTGSFSLLGFYWRRSLRILPVYFLVVTVVGVYFIGIKGQTEFLGVLPFYYLFLSNFIVDHMPFLGPTWSLAVEEQYYLIWPLLLLFAPRRFILPILALLIALNVIAVTGGLRVLGIWPITVGPLHIQMFAATYAPILIGSGLAILLHHQRSFHALSHVLKFKISAPASFLLLLILLNSLPSDLRGWPNLVLHLVMGVSVASIVIREDHILRPILMFRPIARIGEISYGIYLYHMLGIHIAKIGLDWLDLEGAWTAGWFVFVIATLVSIFIAELSFRYYETPFLNLRHRKWRTTS